MKPRKKKVSVGTKTLHLPVGGPIAQKVLLVTPGTLTFRLNGQRGFYDREMKWQAV